MEKIFIESLNSGSRNEPQYINHLSLEDAILGSFETLSPLKITGTDDWRCL